MGISVVLLAYKEAENLTFLLPKIKEMMDSLPEEYEILVIDTKEPLDNTSEVCAQFEFEISTDNLLRLIHKISDAHPVDGFTISGGEPFDQAQDLSELVKEISVISDDILIYSGYKLEELRSRNDTSTEYILNNAAVLIDGAYMEELNDNSLLRGYPQSLRTQRKRKAREVQRSRTRNPKTKSPSRNSPR